MIDYLEDLLQALRPAFSRKATIKELFTLTFNMKTIKFEPTPILLVIVFFRSVRYLYDTTSVIYAHLCLKDLDELAEAQALLTSAIRESKTNLKLNISDLYHQLAEFNLFLNEPRKAAAIYEKHLLDLEAKTRQCVVRYARILRKLGDEKRMRIECSKMLNGMFPNPQTCEDFYYDGFAHFLLGNSERAHYDYERSRRFGSHYSVCFDCDP